MGEINDKKVRFFSKIKKYYYLVILAVLLVAAIGVYAYDKIPSKKVAGDSIVNTISQQGDNENLSESTTSEGSSDTTQSDSVADTNSANKSTGSNSNSSSKQTSPQTSTDSSGNSTDSTDDTEKPTENPAEVASAYVAFWGDSQSDTDQEEVITLQTANYIQNSGANPVFHAGDIMEDGTQDSLDRFGRATANLRASRSFYSTLGNNDRKIGDSSTPSSLFLDYFTFPNNERWYSVNVGNLHMVVLDSAYAASNQTQIDWLISDLQSAASQNRITGVIFHHPPYGYGGDSKGVINTFVPHFINYGVDFVICGHEHGYQHTIQNNIHYFVTSGMSSLGYITATIYSEHVLFTAYNNVNQTINSVDAAKR